MRAAGMDHAVIVGSSAGRGLAVDFTLQHPNAVDRLVLVGADVSGFAVSQHFIDRNTALGRLVVKGDIAGAAQDRWLFAPEHNDARHRLIELLLANPQDLIHPDPDRAAPRRAAPVARPMLSSIKVPTLILVGEDDIADVQGQAGALEALIPGSTRVVVPDAGHLMYTESPAVFADLFSRFVRRAAP
jgi:pimeloyl-ACP methyl ester carboxylesterase